MKNIEDDTDKSPNLRLILYRDPNEGILYREIDGIVWEAQNARLNEGYLGSFLYSSYVNIKANILNEYPHIDKPEGVYGSKLVGSGLKGASFVLINPDFKDELIKYYEKEYNVVEYQL